MNRISAISVVHNEAANIERAFNILKPYVDEFAVIDQGSTDNTVELVKKFTDKVLLFPRVYYSSAYIHEAQLLAKNEWVLHCCPDEVWSKEALESILELVDKDYDVYRFRTINGDDVNTYTYRMWKRLDVIWTDSFNSEVYNREKLKILDLPREYVITNSKSREEGLKNYRLEGCRRLLSRYGDTNVEPYKSLCSYYKEILEGKAL